MGKFLTIFAAALAETEEAFVQSTDVVTFVEETWVYYCRPHLGTPKSGWRDLAAGTLRVGFNPPPFRHDELEWAARVTRDPATGVYHYTAEAFAVEAGNNLYHLALPTGYLPVAGSWDSDPLYGHADRDRFVIGWGGFEANWPVFQFERVTAETFAARAPMLDDDIERRARERRRQIIDPWRPAPPPGPTPDAVMLFKKLQKLSIEEVQNLVFELGIDYDELAGQTKSGKLRELLRFLDRQNQVPRLRQHLEVHYAWIMTG